MSKIEHGSRGTVHLPLGGKDRTIRFRGTEIAALEEKLGGKNPMSFIDPERLTISFVKNAIICGVAHEYIGKKGRAGKLTEAEVFRWIDEVEERDGILYEDLVAALVKAIVGGSPNGKRLTEAMDEAEEAEGNGEAAE